MELLIKGKAREEGFDQQLICDYGIGVNGQTRFK
jgi:hypothetical protein